MMKKFLFLCIFALSTSGFIMAESVGAAMPELSCADQDAEDAEMMESLYDQAEIKQDSRLAAWIKYHGAKIYARYVIAKMFFAQKMREMMGWIKNNKPVVLRA